MFVKFFLLWIGMQMANICYFYYVKHKKPKGEVFSGLAMFSMAQAVALVLAAIVV